MFFPRAFNIEIPNWLVWMGFFWFAMILYLFIGIFLVDIVRLLNYFFDFLPSSLFRNYDTVKLITACSVFMISLITVIFGYINAASPQLKKLEVDIKANASKLKKLECIFMSDIHLGTIINHDRLSKIIEISNSINPDIVLLGGDILDQHISHVIDRDLGDVMVNFKSKYGVFAVLGNHEYFGGYKAAIEYFEKYNVKFLTDAFTTIDNSFIVAGRHDASSERILNAKRKSINEIVSDNRQLPIILLDHQPVNLAEAVKEKISLQLSGHTHDGQLWTLTFITNRVWELAKKKKKVDDTQFYVSSGVGTWGPPIRVGNKAEIVHITINFVD
jgi:predicted MPP superfamily phosphohydrolase